MKRLHSFSALCALALALLIPAAADAQQQGTVYLNDGSVLSGQVIEFVPGDHITLQIGTTPPIVIPQANIARVEMGQTAAPPQPFAPQPTQPYQPPPQQQAYQPAQQPYQPYQLQQPYSAPARRKPGLGLPITFMAVGAVMAITGGALISLSFDSYDYYDDYGTDESLASTPASRSPRRVVCSSRWAWCSCSFVMGQRRRWTQEQAAPVQPQYGFAPIIAPERQLYGLAGTVSF
jgi:hypothetical protein